MGFGEQRRGEDGRWWGLRIVGGRWEGVGGFDEKRDGREKDEGGVRG